MASNDAHRPHERPQDQSPLRALGEARFAGLEPGGWFLADPEPVLIVDPVATLIQANPAGWRLIEASAALSLRRERVAFAEVEAQHAFSRGLSEATLTGASRVILRGNDGQWRPLDLRAWPARPSDLVFVAFCGEPRPLAEVDGIMRAFGLTAAEGEVLRQLTAGAPPKEIARQLGVSTNTVRSHLRTLYLKMHARGIAGVIRQVMRLVR